MRHTGTPVCGESIQFLEARHHAHDRVEDRIRCCKATEFGRFPSRRTSARQSAEMGMAAASSRRTLLYVGWEVDCGGAGGEYPQPLVGPVEVAVGPAVVAGGQRLTGPELASTARTAETPPVLCRANT